MIYVSSSCVKRESIAECIQYMAQNSIKFIELSGGTNYYEGIQNDLRMLRQTYQLEYACHAYFPPPQIPFVVNLASCNDQIYKKSLEHYVGCIEMLKHIQCTVLSVHAGSMVEIGIDEIGRKLSGRVIYDPDKAYDRFCTACERIARLCAKNGISFFIENNVLNAENYKQLDYHNYLMMTDYDTIMKMKGQLDFNLLLDLGHLYVSANTLNLDYMEQCNKLKKYVKWLHISDNDGIWDEHKPLREDSVIMQEFRTMYNSCIDITLETVGEMRDILSSIELVKREV